FGWRDDFHSRALAFTTPESDRRSGQRRLREKPMGNVLAEVKAARDAVVARNLIVQIGTQHRSEPYQIAVRDLVRSDVLGQVTTSLPGPFRSRSGQMAAFVPGRTDAKTPIPSMRYSRIRRVSWSAMPRVSAMMRLVLRVSWEKRPQ